MAQKVIDVVGTSKESFAKAAENAVAEAAKTVRGLKWARARARDGGTLRRRHARNHADPDQGAAGGSQRSHVVRHVPGHPLPRVRRPSRSREARRCGLVAYAGFLRKRRRTL